MPHQAPTFAYFVPYTRDPNAVERQLLEHILSREAPDMLTQVDRLKVVGRCGCGSCPIVFFEEHFPGKKYGDIAAYAGKDHSGGLVGVVPMGSNGRLSQLDFYSVDGHEPWEAPDPSSINPLEKGHA